MKVALLGDLFDQDTARPRNTINSGSTVMSFELTRVEVSPLTTCN